MLARGPHTWMPAACPKDKGYVSCNNSVYNNYSLQSTLQSIYIINIYIYVCSFTMHGQLTDMLLCHRSGSYATYAHAFMSMIFY